jgi:hypothetical protein
MSSNLPPASVDLAATRAMADGELVQNSQSVSAAGVVHESQLRASVARALSNVPVPASDMGERIEHALQEDEILRQRVKVLLHESVGRTPPVVHHSRLKRALHRWAPVAAAAALLVAAVAVPRLLSHADPDMAFPMPQDLGSKIAASYTEAEGAAVPAPFTIDAALDEATQIFGQRPMGIDFKGARTELLWARQTRTSNGSLGYELGFGVYPGDGTTPSTRREVTLLIGRDDEFTRGLMADSRLYRVLGTDLMVRGWRLQGLSYFMTAESKRALFHMQNAMRIPETIEASVDWPDSQSK